MKHIIQIPNLLSPGWTQIYHNISMLDSESRIHSSDLATPPTPPSMSSCAFGMLLSHAEGKK